MKNKHGEYFAILVLICIIVFTFAACSTDSDLVPRNGTWTMTDNSMQFIFSGSNFTLQAYNISVWENVNKGNFTISGTSITFNFTESWVGGHWQTDPFSQSGTITKLNDTSFSLNGGSLHIDLIGTYIKQ